MTQEEINKKALEIYPTNNKMCTIEGKYTKIDTNKDRREGYIRALTDLNLDAIRGEAMHEIADRYESLPKIKGWVARDENGDLNLFEVNPVKVGEKWWDRDYGKTPLDRTCFSELSWKNKPIEVELLIRKV